jgi:Glycosyl transferase family 2/Methyltransferase domain/Glycosyl transferases group 1
MEIPSASTARAANGRRIGLAGEDTGLEVRRSRAVCANFVGVKRKRLRAYTIESLPFAPNHRKASAMPDTGPTTRFVTSASLWPPRLVSEQSAWNEHIPFAGWIVEAATPGVLVELGTHTGVSYFAFCESVLRLGLDNDCFAVDTWLGDDHSGHYGEEVYTAVQRLNSRYYQSFSRLLRTTFDEAVDEFEDGSIDLLHIDGLHTYEAVRHDFETWLPKLSDRGLVLMHDTNERKGDFGVHAYFAELKQRYDTFEFPHGHGLGVICVGPDQPSAVAGLVELADSGDESWVRAIYQALGVRFSNEVAVSRLSEDIGRRNEELRRLAEDVAQRDAEVRRLAGDLGRREQDVRALSDRLAILERETARIRALEAELAEKRDRVGALERRLSAVKKDGAYFRRKLKERTKELRAETKEAKRLARRVEALETSTAWRLTKPLRFLADLVKAPFRPKASRSSSGAAPTAGVQRVYDAFDEDLDAATRHRLRAHYKALPRLSQTLVSIVMPTHNRAALLPAAIESVQRQTHGTWELLIVDDGSDDNTPAVVERYVDDARVRFTRLPWGGVSRARNAGLDLADGSVIAFLDSDNEWDPSFLELTVAALDAEGADIVYSGMEIIEDASTASYRGHEFDYRECLEANYIDLNVLCHRRSIIDDGARFDETLRRMVDWDYLLTIAPNRNVQYEPFVGAVYAAHDASDRITTTEPRLYRRLITTKHSAEPTPGRTMDTRATFRETPLNVAIRIAAPREVRDHWGDYHYAVGLAQAFGRKGHSVEIVYHEEEVKSIPHVVISLRGLTRHEPPPGAVNVLWSISHPDLLSFDEIAAYDLVFSASLTWPEAMRWSGSKQIHVLPQATDRARFFPSGLPTDPAAGVLFVGNSRKADRPIVTSAVEAGLPLSVYGQHWEGRIPDSYIKGQYLPNQELADRYATAEAVLNDHWPSMRDHGYISNRIFDVVASGGKVLSDHVPAIHRMFGDVVATASGPEELVKAYAELRADDHDRREEAMWTLGRHSFDQRVETLVAHIEEFALGTTVYAHREIGLPPCELCAVATDESLIHTAPAAGEIAAAVHLGGTTRSLRVGVVPQPTGDAVTSSAYIRLVQPLTAEIDDIAVGLTRVRPDAESPADVLADLDAVVVSRTAFDDLETAQRWIEASEARGIPVVLDTDDAFHLMDEDHADFASYQTRLEAYAFTLDRAAEVWCSTPALAKSLSGVGPNAIVVANSLDPRLWRRYRQRVEPTRKTHGLQILYAGTKTHGSDLGELLPTLDALAGEVPFGLAVVGVAQEVPERPWLRRIRPGVDTLYPRYARWLRQQSWAFDVGIAPLADTEFNRLKSDVKLLEYLALGLVPLVSDLDPYASSDVVLPEMMATTPDQWAERLRLLATDDAALAEATTASLGRQELVWETRSAALTGETLANRLADLVDHTG